MSYETEIICVEEYQTVLISNKMVGYSTCYFESALSSHKPNIAQILSDAGR